MTSGSGYRNGHSSKRSKGQLMIGPWCEEACSRSYVLFCYSQSTDGHILLLSFQHKRMRGGERERGCVRIERPTSLSAEELDRLRVSSKCSRPSTIPRANFQIQWVLGFPPLEWWSANVARVCF